jgi:hypothetical protein
LPRYSLIAMCCVGCSKFAKEAAIEHQREREQKKAELAAVVAAAEASLPGR